MQQQSLPLAPVTEMTDPKRKRTRLGKGLVLELENGRKGKARLYRGDHLIKVADLTDRVAKKVFVIETLQLGAAKVRLAEALSLSRQTLHNYQEIHKHFGLEGLIHGYRLSDGKDQEKQRALHAEQRERGNKAQQVAAIRAEASQEAVAAQAALNFSFGEADQAKTLAPEEQPFAAEHDWEASRYAGCFVYWPTLIARWHWLQLVMGHFGAGWRLFAVFLLMAGLNIRSIEQLKNVQARESARVLGLERLPAKTQLWGWFYAVAERGLARCVLSDWCRYQIQAGLVSGWIWFTDGHLLPYTGKEKVHYSYNTQRRLPVPGRTSQVTCDGSGRIVDFAIHEGKGQMKQWILQVGETWRAELADWPVMVYDREGHDVSFFSQQVRANRPFVTWQKSVDTERLAALDPTCFATEFTFNGKRYSVFEQEKSFTYTPEDGGEVHAFTLRHIHLWNRSSNRRTCGLTHADPERLSLEEATQAILSRWGASENTFKHLQERHPLHYQPGFKLVESERQEIANPDVKDLQKRLERLHKALNKAYKKLARTPARTNKDGTPRRNSRHQRLTEQIAEQEQELKEHQEKKARLPEKVDVSTLENYCSFKRIDDEGKYLFDFVTAGVWNVRKEMVEWLRGYYERDNDVVDLFYAITQCHGWVRNTPEAVTVRLEPLQQPKRRAAQEQLCRQLTALGAQLPLGKRLVVEVGESPLK